MYATKTERKNEKNNNILKRLNEYSYDKVLDWVKSKGGIQYPCDVYA